MSHDADQGNDSGYESETIDPLDDSDTASLATDTVAMTVIWDRTFSELLPSVWPLPSDDAEVARWSLLSPIFSACLEHQLFSSDIEGSENILEVGTGAGHLAIAAAEKFPDCNIVGLDLDSTQQPRAVPQNLECEVFDVDSHWTFRHQSGFIFGRLFLSYYPPEKWAAFLLQAYHQLEPGGRIEFQEICEKLLSDDNTIPVAYKEWQQQWATACARGGFGTMTEDPEIIRQELYNAGFVDIEIKPYKIPVGTWAKDRKKKVIGSDALRFFEQGFISLGVKPFFKAGWSREDFNALVNRCLSQFKQTKGVHGYMTVFIFTARKPG